MNPGGYVDPKFPPPDEAYQNAYIPANADYYSNSGHYPHYPIPQAGQMMHYGRDTMQYGNHAGAYYQQSCLMSQQQSMGAHMSPQIPQCPSPIQQHMPRSPDGSPDLNSTTSVQMMGLHLPEGSPSEDVMTELDANGQPIIYPWMKKIHIAGVGECHCVEKYMPDIKILIILSIH